MAEKPRGLARRLMDLQREALRLYDATKDTEERRQLLEYCDTLAEQSNRIIDANLNAATEEYRKVTTGIEDASEATREAIKDVKSTQAAINAIAKLVDLASKFAVL